MDFVKNILNKNNEWHNATVYGTENEWNLRVTFTRKHKELYSKLLVFCAENGGIIIRTNPATYETTVQVSARDEAEEF